MNISSKLEGKEEGGNLLHMKKATNIKLQVTVKIITSRQRAFKYLQCVISVVCAANFVNIFFADLETSDQSNISEWVESLI